MVTTPFSNTTTSLAAAIAIEPHAETLRELRDILNNLFPKETTR